MTALPAASAFTGAGVTEAGFKTAIADLRAFLAGVIGTAGTQEEALLTLGAFLGAGVVDKAGSYTVAATDRGKVLNCTGGTFTLTLTAAATLGGGFAFAVRNSGSGVITIDPNGSETIDGVATVSLAAGGACIVTCNGTAFVTIGRISSYAATAGSAPASDVYAWAKSASPPSTGVPLDVGASGVGMFFSIVATSTGVYTAGATYGIIGTCRCVAAEQSQNNHYTSTFQRIA